MQKHLNLIRHIAWNFHRTTGVQWQELFSEACAAYCECLKSYNPQKGAVTTWVYSSMRNALINFCKQEYKNKNPKGLEHWAGGTSYTPMYEFFESKEVSDDVKEVIQMIKETVESNPYYYPAAPQKVFEVVRRDLRQYKDWPWPRIYAAMKSLKKELAEDRVHRTVWLHN